MKDQSSFHFNLRQVKLSFLNSITQIKWYIHLWVATTLKWNLSILLILITNFWSLFQTQLQLCKKLDVWSKALLRLMNVLLIMLQDWSQSKVLLSKENSLHQIQRLDLQLDRLSEIQVHLLLLANFILSYWPIGEERLISEILMWQILPCIFQVSLVRSTDLSPIQLLVISQFQWDSSFVQKQKCLKIPIWLCKFL